MLKDAQKLVLVLANSLTTYTHEEEIRIYVVIGFRRRLKG